MARFSLISHPDYPPRAVESVSVQVDRLPEGGLWLEYAVRGTAALLLPEEQEPGRADDLWTTTCFELFFKAAGGDAYSEFNLSPSFQWAAYGFDSYRTGMRELPAQSPDIEINLNAAPYFFLAAEPWPPELIAGDGTLALTAVIEEQGGVKSYWSLAHPPGAPDFHHPACFVGRLPALGGA
ncbi:MAG: hypothetical protein JWN21_1967 [Sphingomonas bacterium]|uniref:DOMON-like domain-containing protein n=1 Tax=Sphingomonas bacterium TaxID=1895847 RepID=UPI0026215ECF|nr:DOMON-like domain-containing protein [Sphingomonas bacterium]MDB5696424.1 hypothetical protein [Sphingomonas bacterium]